MSRDGDVEKIKGLYIKVLTGENASEADIFDALVALKGICPGDQGIAHPPGDTVVAIINNGMMSIMKVDKKHYEFMMRVLQRLASADKLTTVEAFLKLADLGAKNTPRSLF